MKSYDCIIVGAGAAGLCAAYYLSKQKKKILIIEQLKEAGKKLYATGNGRCNFTNSFYDMQVYRGDEAFARHVYQQFTYQDTIQYMHEIGVLDQEKDGYYYPYTNQAKTVVTAMIESLPKTYVTFCLDRIVKKIQKTKSGFHIITSYGEFDSESVLLSCGGLAGLSNKKITYEGFNLVTEVGHTVQAPVPALCALKVAQFDSLKGIRANGSVQLFVNQECSTSCSPKAVGELQFTKDGISGIPTFQVSRYAAKQLQQKNKVYAKIDLFPYYTKQEMFGFLSRFVRTNKSVGACLLGMLQEPILRVLLNKAKMTFEQRFDTVSQKQLERLVELCKNWTLRISDTATFEQAQVMAGGVYTKEICADNMQSQIVPGLFLAGEMIDVDGTCGGYNLQFAFSSAFVASKGICEYLESRGKTK